VRGRASRAVYGRLFGTVQFISDGSAFLSAACQRDACSAKRCSGRKLRSILRPAAAVQHSTDAAELAEWSDRAGDVDAAPGVGSRSVGRGPVRAALRLCLHGR